MLFGWFSRKMGKRHLTEGVDSMQTWTDEALRALLCEELEAASYPVRRKQLIERSAARLGERVYFSHVILKQNKICRTLA